MNISNRTFGNEYSLLSNGYFRKLKTESKSENWEKVRILLSQKRKDIVSLIEKNIGVNISDRIDYTGSSFISNEILQNNNLPKYLKDFLQSTHFLQKNGKIFSRGHSYYFLYAGLSYQEDENPLIDRKSKVKEFNVEEFYSNIESHITGIFTSFEVISNMPEGEIDPEIILKINLILLDQLKNIILFSLNFCLIYFDPKFFGKNGDGERIDSTNILNSQELLFLEKNGQIPSIDIEDQIGTDKEGNVKYGRIIDTIFRLLPGIEHDFAIAVLNTPNKDNDPYLLAGHYASISNFQPILLHSFTYLRNLFRSIDQASVGGENFSLNIRNKVIKKLIRHNREEDNFLFMLQTVVDKLRSIQAEFPNEGENKGIIEMLNRSHFLNAAEISGLKQIDVICPLYGGTEMPFILKALGDTIKSGISINIRLIAYSYYDLKNANTKIDISNYPALDKNISHKISELTHFTRKKLNNIITGAYCLILDDNVYTGRTLNDFHSRFSKEYIKVFIATTASKIHGSKAIKYEDTKLLLKKIMPTSGYAIPDKNGKNGIVYQIGKRLKTDHKKKQ